MARFYYWAPVLVCFAVSIVPTFAQYVRTQPTWPSDQDFLIVNQAIDAACQRTQGVDQELVWALIWEESKYDPLAVGLKGEVD